MESVPSGILDGIVGGFRFGVFEVASPAASQPEPQSEAWTVVFRQ
nr:hypothetical protein [Rhodopirellula sp. SM50]